MKRIVLRNRREGASRTKFKLRAMALACALVLAGLLTPAVAHAQRAIEARSGVADSTVPPITPGRAFLYSLILPGLGQARLDRPFVGAGFFLVEAFTIALVHRTADDLRLARAYSRDSVPLRYAIDDATGIAQVDGKGSPVVAEWQHSYYSDALVRARRLQLEDWTAILIFNHLIAGAEAFVASQLWDLPQHVKLQITPLARGYGIGAQIRTR